MQDFKVNILGTDYVVKYRKPSEDEYLEKNRDTSGYVSKLEKYIVIRDISEDEGFAYTSKEEQEVLRKETIRHEIIHAFLKESGLDGSSFAPTEGWACNEEMVDWIAIQSPKLFKIFTELKLM